MYFYLFFLFKISYVYSVSQNNGDKNYKSISHKIINKSYKFLHRYNGYCLVFLCSKFDLNSLYTFWDRDAFWVVCQELFYPISWNRRLQQNFSWIVSQLINPPLDLVSIRKSSKFKAFRSIRQLSRTIDIVPGSVHFHDKILGHNQNRYESVQKCVKPIIAFSDATKWRFQDNTPCNNVPWWL